MNKKYYKICFILILALVIGNIQPCNIFGATKKYIKSLSISSKKVQIRVGKSKSLSYRVKAKGKANKKITVKSSNTNIKVRKGNGKIKIVAKKVGSSKITVITKGKNKKGKKIKKTVKVVVIRKTTDKSPQPTVTKSEWISSLMETTNYKVQSELFDYGQNGSVTYSFSDISKDKNVEIIETAVKYGIIPVADGEFKPNSAVTREFLAVTSIRAIGFASDTQRINYKDKAELKYATEDAIAIQLGLLKLSDNKFEPTKYITKTEKENAVGILSEIISGREINEKHENVVKYNGEVKDNTDVTDYELSQENGVYTITVPKGTSLDKVIKGDKIILPETHKYSNGIALVVTSSVLSTDGRNRIIMGKGPDTISDFVDSVDIEGIAKADVKNITAIEGVSTVEAKEGVNQKKNRNNGKKLRKNVNGQVDLKDKTEISYTINELSTTVSFYLSELNYNVDFNKKGVNAIYIGLPSVLSIKTSYKASKKFSKKIGDITIELAAGFSVALGVYLEAEISGEIKIELKLSNNVGVQYYNGQFYVEKSCEPSLDVLVDADVDTGVKLQLGLYWMKGIQEVFGKGDSTPIYNVHTKWGLHGDATLRIRNDQFTSYKNLACVELAYHLYGNIGVGDGSFLGDKFNLKKTWTIFNYENSPFKGAMHIENGKKVNACTYKKNGEALFKEFVAKYKFLCDETKAHDVFVAHDGEYSIRSNTDIEEKPFSYDIADFDSDGDNELLIVNNAHSFNDYNGNLVEDSGEGFETLKLQMYEANQGEVQLKAEKECTVLIEEISSFKLYTKIPSYDTLTFGGTDIYKYTQGKQQVIVAEHKAQSIFADGTDLVFIAVTYDGQKFINRLEYSCLGLDSENTTITFNDMNDKFAKIGLNIDAKNILWEEKRVIDYINNPIIIGRSVNNSYVDYNTYQEIWSNPNVKYKIGQIRFMR